MTRMQPGDFVNSDWWIAKGYPNNKLIFEKPSGFPDEEPLYAFATPTEFKDVFQVSSVIVITTDTLQNGWVLITEMESGLRQVIPGRMRALRWSGLFLLVGSGYLSLFN